MAKPKENADVISEIEEAQRRVSTDAYGMSVGEFMSMYRDDELVVSPPFQRLFRWTPLQKAHLIESLLIGIPIPPVFVYEQPSGVWELIDGLQRISTILEFAGILNDAEGKPVKPSILFGTEYLPSLDGSAYDLDAATVSGASHYIPRSMQLQFKRAKLDVQILRSKSDEVAKYDVFQRLNSQGSPLEAQEMRTCLMVMIDEDRYDTIRNSAQAKPFLEIIGLSATGKDQQKDIDFYCRAIAHLSQEFLEEYDVEEFVDYAIREFMVSKPANFTKVLNKIDRAAVLLRSVDKNILRPYKSGAFSGRVGRVAFESIFVGVAANIDKIEALGPKAAAFVRTKAMAMWGNAAVKSFSGSGVRGTDRIKKTVPFGSKWFEPK